MADGLTVNVYNSKQDTCLGIITGCTWRETQSGNDETFQTLLGREVTITGPRPSGYKIDWTADNRVWLYFKLEGRAWRAEANTCGSDLALVFEVQDVPEAHED